MKILLTVFLLCFFSATANAQNITAARALSFGSLLKPVSGSGWLNITAVATNPVITGDLIRLGSSTPVTAQFNVVSSKARQYYAITLPLSVILTNSYSSQITLDQLAHSYGTANGRTSPSKTDTFYVGGRINISSTVTGGTFSGIMNIMIDFL